MIINPMNIFDNSRVDMSYFNTDLISKGGKPLKTDKPIISMREFIFKLIKTFRKDFNKKKKGGVADLYNDSDVSFSLNTNDLIFDSYKFPPTIQPERDML